MSKAPTAAGSISDRCLLGTKIALRRRELGLTVEELAALLEEPAHIVRRFELNAPLDESVDAKLEAALQVPPGWLRAELDRSALTAARAGLLRKVHGGPARANATQLRKHYGGRALQKRPAGAAQSAIQVRRTQLGMTLLELSERTSIHWAVLRDFETSLPASTHLDSIIESALFLPDGALRAGELIGPPRLADEITAIIADLITQVSPNASPADVVANMQMALQRYGLHGDERAEYPVISADFDRPEESVQQVMASLKAAAHSAHATSPSITFLARELDRMLPARIDELTNYFRPLLGGQLSLNGVNRFAADFFDRALFLGSEGQAFPIWDPAREARELVLDAETVYQVGIIAGAMVHRVGAAQARVVARAASKATGHTIGPDDVVRILSDTRPRFDWLSPDSGWFWFGPEPLSAPMSLALKLLLGADRPLRLTEVLTGLTRGKQCTPSQFDIEATLPEHILWTVLAKTPAVQYTVDGYFSIRSTVKERAPEFVSAAEQLLLDELRRRGGTASRPELRAGLVHSGKLGSQAFEAELKGSPLFRQLEDTRWSYVGAQHA